MACQRGQTGQSPAEFALEESQACLKKGVIEEEAVVYADFDWVKEIVLVGELSYELLRGKDNYGFTFEDARLKRYGNLFLSADLNNYSGPQYTRPTFEIC